MLVWAAISLPFVLMGALVAFIIDAMECGIDFFNDFSDWID